MVRFPPLVLAATALAVAVTALLMQPPAAGSAPPASAAPALCGDGAIALLVDGSGSMADHDRSGALRRAAGAALDARVAAGGVVTVRRFAGTLGVARHGAQVEARIGRVVATGDAGPTELVTALAALGRVRPRPAVIAVVTDAEPAEPARLPRALRGRPIVLAAAGGRPPDWMRRLARASGGDAVALTDHAGAAAFASAVAGASGCHSSPGPSPGDADGGDADGDDVVLVSGLGDRAGEVRGADSAAECAPALSLAAWCRALAAGGRRVWVPSIAPRGRLAGGRRATIDSTGRLAGNGAALAAWVRRVLPGRSPALVGHSMGGLIAHAAVSWSGLPAGALVTVGTPHTGSYGADAYLAARAGAIACRRACPGTSAALAAGAATVRVRFGAALDDLTRRRRLHAQPLPRLAVPAAAYAGAVNHLPGPLAQLLARAARASGAASPSPGYLLPNDGIVGVSSALGTGSAFSPRRSEPAGAARHSASVLPARAPTQLADPAVARFIVGALDGFARASLVGGARGLAQVRGERLRPGTPFRAANTPRLEFPRAPGRAPRRRGGAVVRQISAPLTPVLPLDDLAAGQAVGDPAGVVVSADPLTLQCDGTAVDAVPVLGALWVIDLGALGCVSVTAEPRPGGGEPPHAVALGSEAPEWAPPARRAPRATLLRRAGGAWRVTVAAVDARPVVHAGGQRVAMAARRHGAYRGAIGPRLARRARELTVLARRADGVPLAATIELDP